VPTRMRVEHRRFAGSVETRAYPIIIMAPLPIPPEPPSGVPRRLSSTGLRPNGKCWEPMLDIDAKCASSVTLLMSTPNWCAMRVRTCLAAVAEVWCSSVGSMRRRFCSPLEKYFAEVRLQRFGIGRLTTEADIAVGTDHIQTCTPSSIAVV
jgi:hypothetical protein